VNHNTGDVVWVRLLSVFAC